MRVEKCVSTCWTFRLGINHGMGGGGGMVMRCVRAWRQRAVPTGCRQTAELPVRAARVASARAQPAVVHRPPNITQPPEGVRSKELCVDAPHSGPRSGRSSGGVIAPVEWRHHSGTSGGPTGGHHRVPFGPLAEVGLNAGRGGVGCPFRHLGRQTSQELPHRPGRHFFSRGV